MISVRIFRFTAPSVAYDLQRYDISSYLPCNQRCSNTEFALCRARTARLFYGGAWRVLPHRQNITHITVIQHLLCDIARIGQTDKNSSVLMLIFKQVRELVLRRLSDAILIPCVIGPYGEYTAVKHDVRDDGRLRPCIKPRGWRHFFFQRQRREKR